MCVCVYVTLIKSGSGKSLLVRAVTSSIVCAKCDGHKSISLPQVDIERLTIFKYATVYALNVVGDSEVG